MKVITYSLVNPDKYYEDVSVFTYEVIDKMDSVNELVEGFKTFIMKNNIEGIRSDLDYSLELLTLGVLWRTYINKAVRLKKIPSTVLISLSDLREKGSIKKPIDCIRRVLGTLFLYKEGSKKAELTLDNFKKLITWLSSTGEFKEEVKRMKTWMLYLYNKSKNKVNNTLLSCVNLARWFEGESEERLGFYTENVNDFIEETNKKYKWEENFVFTRRKRVEYHLNMVGAEIMNRCLREEFLKAKEKRLLLPACMRINQNNYCRAIETKDGYLCRGCSIGCNVSKYTKLGEKYNFKVYIIHHESSAFTKEKVEAGKIGIVGVACVLNLISGGWKAKDLGLVPQCVLLNYCGCKKHWDERGIITDINVNRLLHTIGVNK